MVELSSLLNFSIFTNRKVNLIFNIIRMNENKTRKGEACLNCKETFTRDENFCSNCGQKNDRKRLSVKEYISEALGNFFSFDSKILASLVPFFTRPGMLTRKYVDGERVKYIVPFRMYMFFSVLFFLVSGYLQDNTNMNKMLRTELSDQLVFNDNGERLDTKVVDSLIRQAVDSVFSNSNDTMQVLDSDSIPISANKSIAARKKNLSINKAYQYAKVNPDTSVSNALRHLNIEPTWINTVKYDFYTKFVRVDRADLVNDFIGRIPLFIFLFMPFLAIMLKLFYVRRDIYYSEHLTFLLQTYSMLFLLATICVVSHKVFMYQIYGIAALLFAIYFLVAMKNFYKQGWIKTMFKYFLLGFSYLVLLPIFTLLAMAFSYMFF